MAPIDRQMMLDALTDHAKGQISKHKTNVEVYLNNAAGVGEHTDVVESVEKEIENIAKYDDQLAILNKYFVKKDPFKTE